MVNLSTDCKKNASFAPARATPPATRGDHRDANSAHVREYAQFELREGLGETPNAWDRPIRTALLSVSDKSGLGELGEELLNQGVDLIATGGTEKYLRDLECAKDFSESRIQSVEKFTRFPENLNGRLKTLHPQIQAGILAVRDEHDKVIRNLETKYVDLVIVNLYQFKQTVESGAPFEGCIENIDIGGPALIRGAAKNHKFVTVIVDPKDYKILIDVMRDNNACTTLDLRRYLAAKAFAHTASYDSVIADWFAGVI